MECLRIPSLSSTCGRNRPQSALLAPGRSRLDSFPRLNAHATQRERVLRYPDGHERRIIYPAVMTLDEDDDDYNSWDVSGLWGGAAAQEPPSRAQASAVQAYAQRHAHSKQTLGAERSLQDTQAFLEGLFAASYASQPLEDVKQRYEVMDGCPWVLPRPVFVLTSQQWGWQADDGIQSTYTLRIKMVKEGAADAIAKLLNKQNLAAALDIAEMRDGLVVFESADDADRFASMLEEEGHSQVMVAEVDSHRVFRMVSDVNALAVLLRAGCSIPAPFQLAASLRQQQSWDNRL